MSSWERPVCGSIDATENMTVRSASGVPRTPRFCSRVMLISASGRWMSRTTWRLLGPAKTEVITEHGAGHVEVAMDELDEGDGRLGDRLEHHGGPAGQALELGLGLGRGDFDACLEGQVLLAAAQLDDVIGRTWPSAGRGPSSAAICLRSSSRIFWMMSAGCSAARTTRGHAARMAMMMMDSFRMGLPAGVIVHASEARCPRASWRRVRGAGIAGYITRAASVRTLCMVKASGIGAEACACGCPIGGVDLGTVQILRWRSG